MDDASDDLQEVTRRVELDVSVEELWELVGDSSGWADWLVESAEVDLVEGATGRVVVDGEERDVAMGPVETGVGVRFEWWPSATPDDRSIVELVVAPGERGARLDIRERFVGPRIMASAVADRSEVALRWELRVAMLWVRATLGALVHR